MMNKVQRESFIQTTKERNPVKGRQNAILHGELNQIDTGSDTLPESLLCPKDSVRSGNL